MGPRNAFRMLKAAFWQCLDRDPFTQGAALAYYAIFSLAPIVVIAIAIAGFVFGPQAAQGQLAKELSRQTSPQVAQAIEGLVGTAYQAGSGPIATIISVIVLLIGATSFFGQVQHALNIVWGVTAQSGHGILGVLKARFWSFVAVLGVGVLLIVSLISAAVLTAIANFLDSSWLGDVALWRAINGAASFAVLTLMFAMIYRLLPDVAIAWSDVWFGAAVTSLLLTAGKYVIGLYLGHSSITSPYGAAGSLVIIVVWVYYSMQIFLFGAELTQVYANHSGRSSVAAASAMPSPATEASSPTMPV